MFELGYLVGRLGRRKVFALRKSGDLEGPSNYDGVLFIEMDEQQAWKTKLANALGAANVDSR